MATALLESRDVDLDIRMAEAEAALGDPCPPATDGTCSLCDEPLSLAIIVPCSSTCCDREVCLDCALRHGYPIR